MATDQRLQATRGDGVALCGNARHPLGPWHVSEPMPFYPGWTAILTRRGRELRRRVRRYERRREAWGCGCPLLTGPR